MGLTKRMLMEYEERGYGSSDESVCYECIGDSYLKDLIRSEGRKGICDYCGESSITICLEDLMGYIMMGINSEYEHAIDCLPYEPKEGGYYGSDTWDNYDVIWDINSELLIDNDRLCSDIIDIMDDSIVWCVRDPFSLRMDKEDFYTWRSFCELLKYKIRYVFFLNVIESNTDYNRYSRPSEILERIGEGIESIGLVRKIEADTVIFRGRMHSKKESEFNAKSLGSPPTKYVTSNRMNPEGISMFYGSFEKITAITEIFDSSKYAVTIGGFKNQRDLIVIDLSLIEDISTPSLFDTTNYNTRMMIQFLKQFNNEIVKRIETEEKLEYIPTQVMTEYFRHVFRVKEKPIDGIVYSSSVKCNGKCIVLFFDNRFCSDEKDNVLWLDKNSIETIEVKDFKLSIKK